MDKPKTKEAVEQLTKKLQTSGLTSLQKKADCYEISIYIGESTVKGRATAVSFIKDAFPSLDVGFHKILAQRVTQLEISDERFVDAVNYVIDNCVYPTPTIANFISYDKKIRSLNYAQLINVEEYLRPLYKAVRIGDLDKPMYAVENDIKEYKLELFNK